MFRAIHQMSPSGGNANSPTVCRVLVVGDRLAPLIDGPKPLKDPAGRLVQLVYAADGRSALALAATATPDAALIDIDLPGIDGLAVCARLREATETLGIPIMLLGGEVSDAVRGFAADLGAIDCMARPMNADQLRRVVALAVGRCRLPGEPAEATAAMKRLAERLGDRLMSSHQRLTSRLCVAGLSLARHRRAARPH